MTKFISVRSKSGSISCQLNKKTLYIFTILFLFSLLIFVISLSVGSSHIHPLAVIKHLFGYGSGEYDFTINTLRLPRVLLAFLVGSALGVSGLILQGIVRNPLASPDIIGITGGASVGAVIFIVYFVGAISIKLMPLAALLGATIVSIIVYSLSWKKGVTPIRLVLIGIGVAAAANAIVTMFIVLSDTFATTRAYLWLTGSLYGANLQDVLSMLPWVLIFIPVSLLFSRTMDVKELGDDVALGLGVNVQLQRLLLLFISVSLAGAAVAFAGGIGFVGLIAPHIARMLAGRSFAGLVPTSALIGGIIVMVADIVARTAFLPLDIPAGVFTSGIGAPFFIYLLYRNRNM
ncbi:FecCD family ABC transporter permease [Aquibacillus albus]|uniref:Iron complex transport system permease protein n=1 Tax=Aquibacillus albus TaxID=1168171 RepID=A0ABS2N3U1_9BACI|nr:iron ABC transporter permease [Aquibacillus albus]MBM7572759.1 iron complex transport system permease protein [Aquibacillus albus]